MRPVLVTLAFLLAGCAAPAAPLDVPGAEPGPEPVLEDLPPAEPPATAPEDARSPGPTPVPPAVRCVAPCVRPIDDRDTRPWEPMVAANPLHPLHLVAGNAVWSDLAPGFRNSWLEAHVSRDGGASWEHVPLPGGPGAGPEHPLATMTAMGDAVVAFLPDGTALFAGLAFNHAGTSTGSFARTSYAFFVARSPDGGTTWPEVAVVAEGQGLSFGVALPDPVGPVAGLPLAWSANDKEWLAVGSGGEVLAAWSRLVALGPEEPDGYRCDLVASASADGGRTWSMPSVLATSDAPTLGAGACYIGAAPVVGDDAWHVAFVELGTLDLALATSTDGGASWTAQSLGPSGPMPALARDAAGRLYLAYGKPEEPGPCPAYWECLVQPPVLRWSDDAGATWSDPVPLQAPGGPGRTLPALAVAGDGTVFALSCHPTGESRAELRVVAVRDGQVGPPAVLDGVEAACARLGDYLGLAPLPAGAFATWVRSADGAAFDLVGAELRATDPQP